MQPVLTSHDATLLMVWGYACLPLLQQSAVMALFTPAPTQVLNLGTADFFFFDVVH